MAFNINAQVVLSGPKNLGKIKQSIQKSLGGSVPINLTFSPQAASNLAKFNSQLNAATAGLQKITQASSSFSNSLKTISNNAATAASAVQKVSNTAASTSQSLSQATNQMVLFGKDAALAVRRFAAFSIATGAIYGLIRSIQSATKEAIEFQREMNRLKVVTDGSTSQIKDFQSTVDQLSTSLGLSSLEIAKVGVTIAQSGRKMNEVKSIVSAIAKASLTPSFGNMEDTAEGVIAVLEQFRISADRTEAVLGSLNAVSKAFAVESADLIATIRKTGGVFATASVDLSKPEEALADLLGIFTSVRSTTRESAETIATGLRTIFSRLQRKSTIDFLKQFQIDLVDTEGKFIGFFESFRRLSEGLSGIQKSGDVLTIAKIVEELGGIRQVGKLIPAIQQFTKAEQARRVALEGTGSMTRDVAMATDTLAVKIQQLQQRFTKLFRDIADSSTFQDLAKFGISAANAFISMADALRPLLPMLTTLAAIKVTGAAFNFTRGFVGGLKKYDGGPIPRFAGGGLVPGQGNRDSFPARLTPGEYVIKKSSVEKLGTGYLNSINRNAGGIIPRRYMTGNVVGRKTITDSVFEKLETNRQQFATPFKGTTTTKAGYATEIKNKKGENVQFKIRAGKEDKYYGGAFLSPIGQVRDLKIKLDKNNIQYGLNSKNKYFNKLSSDGQKQVLNQVGALANKPIPLVAESLSAEKAKQIEKIILNSVISAVQKGGKALSDATRTKIDQGKSSEAARILKKTNIDNIIGNVFEAMLINAGAPYKGPDPTTANARWDFPQGLKAVAKNFGSGRLTNITTDAKTRFSPDNIKSLIEKIRAREQNKLIESVSSQLGTAKPQGGVPAFLSRPFTTLGKPTQRQLAQYLGASSYKDMTWKRLSAAGVLAKNSAGSYILEPNAIKQWQKTKGFNAGGFVQKFVNGGGVKLYDDLDQGLKGNQSLPRPSAIEDIIKKGRAAFDLDNTLFNTVGDTAFSKARSSAKEEVLIRYFRNPIMRMRDVAAGANFTQLGSALKQAINEGLINPNNLAIISKSQAKGVPGLKNYITKTFGIPKSNMVFTEGRSKRAAFQAFAAGEKNLSRFNKPPKPKYVPNKFGFQNTSKFADGGRSGTDSVRALLTPGEFVISKPAAESIGYSNLARMNRHGKAAGGAVQKFANGGKVKAAGLALSQGFAQGAFALPMAMSMMSSTGGAMDPMSMMMIMGSLAGIVESVKMSYRDQIQSMQQNTEAQQKNTGQQKQNTQAQKAANTQIVQSAKAQAQALQLSGAAVAGSATMQGGKLTGASLNAIAANPANTTILMGGTGGTGGTSGTGGGTMPINKSSVAFKAGKIVGGTGRRISQGLGSFSMMPMMVASMASAGVGMYAQKQGRQEIAGYKGFADPIGAAQAQSYGGMETALQYAGAGGTLGAMIGSAIAPGIGTAIGGLIGAASAGIYGFFSGQEKAIKDQIKFTQLKGLQDSAKNLSMTFKNLAESGNRATKAQYQSAAVSSGRVARGLMSSVANLRGQNLSQSDFAKQYREIVEQGLPEDVVAQAAQSILAGVESIFSSLPEGLYKIVGDVGDDFNDFYNAIQNVISSKEFASLPPEIQQKIQFQLQQMQSAQQVALLGSIKDISTTAELSGPMGQEIANSFRQQQADIISSISSGIGADEAIAQSLRKFLREKSPGYVGQLDALGADVTDPAKLFEFAGTITGNSVIRQQIEMYAQLMTEAEKYGGQLLQNAKRQQELNKQLALATANFAAFGAAIGELSRLTARASDEFNVAGSNFNKSVERITSSGNRQVSLNQQSNIFSNLAGRSASEINVAAEALNQRLFRGTLNTGAMNLGGVVSFGQQLPEILKKAVTDIRARGEYQNPVEASDAIIDSVRSQFAGFDLLPDAIKQKFTAQIKTLIGGNRQGEGQSGEADIGIDTIKDLLVNNPDIVKELIPQSEELAKAFEELQGLSNTLNEGFVNLANTTVKASQIQQEALMFRFDKQQVMSQMRNPNLSLNQRIGVAESNFRSRVGAMLSGTGVNQDNLVAEKARLEQEYVKAEQDKNFKALAELTKSLLQVDQAIQYSTTETERLTAIQAKLSSIEESRMDSRQKLSQVLNQVANARNPLEANAAIQEFFKPAFAAERIRQTGGGTMQDIAALFSDLLQGPNSVAARYMQLNPQMIDQYLAGTTGFLLPLIENAVGQSYQNAQFGQRAVQNVFGLGATEALATPAEQALLNKAEKIQMQQAEMFADNTTLTTALLIDQQESYRQQLGITYNFMQQQAQQVNGLVNSTQVAPAPVVQAANKAKGGMIYASKGGSLINFQEQGTDTEPAMLTPGEFVVNARDTAKNLPLLKAINSGKSAEDVAMASRGGRIGYFNSGGMVKPSYFADGGLVGNPWDSPNISQGQREILMAIAVLKAKTGDEKLAARNRLFAEMETIRPWESGTPQIDLRVERALQDAKLQIARDVVNNAGGTFGVGPTDDRLLNEAPPLETLPELQQRLYETDKNLNMLYNPFDWRNPIAYLLGGAAFGAAAKGIGLGAKLFSKIPGVAQLGSKASSLFPTFSKMFGAGKGATTAAQASAKAQAAAKPTQAATFNQAQKARIAAEAAEKPTQAGTLVLTPKPAAPAKSLTQQVAESTASPTGEFSTRRVPSNILEAFGTLNDHIVKTNLAKMAQQEAAAKVTQQAAAKAAQQTTAEATKKPSTLSNILNIFKPKTKPVAPAAKPVAPAAKTAEQIAREADIAKAAASQGASGPIATPYNPTVSQIFSSDANIAMAGIGGGLAAIGVGGAVGAILKERGLSLSTQTQTQEPETPRNVENNEKAQQEIQAAKERDPNFEKPYNYKDASKRRKIQNKMEKIKAEGNKAERNANASRARRLEHKFEIEGSQARLQEIESKNEQNKQTANVPLREPDGFYHGLPNRQFTSRAGTTITGKLVRSSGGTYTIIGDDGRRYRLSTRDLVFNLDESSRNQIEADARSLPPNYSSGGLVQYFDEGGEVEARSAAIYNRIKTMRPPANQQQDLALQTAARQRAAAEIAMEKQAKEQADQDAKLQEFAMAKKQDDFNIMIGANTTEKERIARAMTKAYRDNDFATLAKLKQKWYSIMQSGQARPSGGGTGMSNLASGMMANFAAAQNNIAANFAYAQNSMIQNFHDARASLASGQIYRRPRRDVFGYASGGKVIGASGIDNVPAMLTDGEYVINKSSAYAIGGEVLDHMNATGKIPTYLAEGGAFKRIQAAREARKVRYQQKQENKAKEYYYSEPEQYAKVTQQRREAVGFAASMAGIGGMAGTGLAGSAVAAPVAKTVSAPQPASGGIDVSGSTAKIQSSITQAFDTAGTKFGAGFLSLIQNFDTVITKLQNLPALKISTETKVGPIEVVLNAGGLQQIINSTVMQQVATQVAEKLRAAGLQRNADGSLPQAMV